MKVWLDALRLVTVIVCVTVGLAALTMPKSNSGALSTSASGVSVLAGSAMVVVAAFAALTVNDPGPLPVSEMLHWLEGSSVAPQLLAKV